MEVKGNSQLQGLLDRSLAIFTGKGGVGKTVTAAAFARVAARSGKRVLLAEVRASRRVPHLFGRVAEGDGPQELIDGITWRNFTPAVALETYALRIVRFKSVYRAVFEHRAVRRFLEAVPSLAEILMLGHLVFILEEGRFDLVSLDAPSSGPGALMLGAPQAVMETAPRGPLLDAAVWIHERITDPARSSVNLVVTPEELPVSEAIGLRHRLRDELRAPLGMVFANRVLEDPFSDLPPARIDRACELMSDRRPGFGLAVACRHIRSRLRLQDVYLDRLRAGVDLPLVTLPEISQRPDGQAVVEGLTRAMEQP